jgi:membrane protease YdiL (CAAX protease family)
MKNLSKKNPVLYCILLVIIVMLAAAVLTGAFTVAGFRDLSSSIARIIIFAVLVFIFRDCYHWDKSFSGITYALAALIPAVWNIAYNSFNGAVLRSDLPVVLICALAPAVFEESLFRIIPFQKMEDQNMSKMSIVLITALVFGLIHLTNMVSGNVVGTLVQTFYAVAVGLLFGGLYILYNYLPVPMQVQPLLQMLPYLVTILVLVFVSIRRSRESQPPAALGRNYYREDR